MDNSTGAYISIGPELPQTQITMSKILAELANRGTQIVIATLPDSGNRQVLDGMSIEAGSNRLIFHERIELHAKGIVGDRFALSGSMNLTFNGLEGLSGALHFRSIYNFKQ